MVVKSVIVACIIGLCILLVHWLIILIERPHVPTPLLKENVRASIIQEKKMTKSAQRLANADAKRNMFLAHLSMHAQILPGLFNAGRRRKTRGSLTAIMSSPKKLKKQEMILMKASIKDSSKHLGAAERRGFCRTQKCVRSKK